MIGYGLAAVTFLAIGITVAERTLWSGRVLPGVQLASVQVSGRSEKQAGAVIAAYAQRLEREPLMTRAAKQQFSVAPTAIGLHADTTRTFIDVRGAGRRGNPVATVAGTFIRFVRPDKVTWTVTYDSAKLDSVIGQWAKKVGTTAVDGGIEVHGATVVPVRPKTGTELPKGATQRRVQRALRTGTRTPIALPLAVVRASVDDDAVEQAAGDARRLLAAPVTVTVEGVATTLTPEALGRALRSKIDKRRIVLQFDHDALRTELGPEIAKKEVPVRDAGWNTNGDVATVVPSQIGHLTDLDALEAAILGGQRTVAGTLHDVAPHHDTAWAEGLHITKKVSTFRTEHPTGQPRVKNIHRAADIMQNYVIEPGKRFSLNEALGERTEARGFVKAPVIYDDEFKEDVGGGVSQFATTLYNAVFFGGYKIVYHQAHSFYISRYPMGREATVSIPSPDLVFDNDSSAGILLRTAYTAGSITVTFYGDIGARTVKAEGPNVLKTVEPGTDFIDDPTLPSGTEKEIDHAFPGYEVEVFRVISEPGKPDIRQRIFTRYRVHNRKVARGTAAPPPATGPTSSTVPGAPTIPTSPGPTTTTTRK
jgi:vancomycin resistance protein YoaR